MDINAIICNILTLAAVCVSIGGLVHVMNQSKSDDSASMERVINNTESNKSDLAEIKAQNSMMLEAQHSMDTRLALVESSANRAHVRLDAHSDRLDDIERAHYGFVGTHDNYTRTQGGDDQ